MEYKGPWSPSRVSDYLQDARVPIRLATVGADGFPRVVSLWFQFADGRFECVTHGGSQLAALLREEPRVGFEVAADAPPYHGVRGQGVATLQPLGDATTLEDLLQRYLGGSESPLADWLLSRKSGELLITIEPRRLYSWDYRRRMSASGAETP
jgi:hypothetical protein